MNKMLSLAPLDPLQRDVMCTVLQDCVDQLSILGGIIPNYADKPSALDAVSRGLGGKGECVGGSKS